MPDAPKRSHDRPLRLASGEAWLKCRRAGADPASFGHGSETGWWFLKVNVLRDHYALNGHETWDRWREAPQRTRSIPNSETELLDELAARPEQPLIEVPTGWLEPPAVQL